MPVITYNGLLSPKHAAGGRFSPLVILQARTPSTFASAFLTPRPSTIVLVTDSPGLSVAVAQDSVNVKVTFGDPAEDNAALRSPVSYDVDPSLTVCTVTPEGVAKPTYVVLTTEEMLNDQLYELNLIRLKS